MLDLLFTLLNQRAKRVPRSTSGLAVSSAISRKAQLLVVGFISLSVCCLAQSTDPGKQAAAPLSLVIVAVSPTVHAGTPVLVNITIRNNTNAPRLVETQIPSWFLDFDVRDEKGNRSESRRGRVLSDPHHRGMQPGDDLPVRGGSAYLLQPGKSVVVENVPVPDLWDLSNPGTYQIQVRRSAGQEGVGMVTSNKISVTVAP